jgi:hypothetical protein
METKQRKYLASRLYQKSRNRFIAIAVMGAFSWNFSIAAEVEGPIGTKGELRMKVNQIVQAHLLLSSNKIIMQ